MDRAAEICLAGAPTLLVGAGAVWITQGEHPWANAHQWAAPAMVALAIVWPFCVWQRNRLRRFVCPDYWTSDRIAIAWLPTASCGLSLALYSAALYVPPLHPSSVFAPGLPSREVLAIPYRLRLHTFDEPQGPYLLNLVFKDSPLFTDSRKRFISGTVESFYRYLSALGFSIPSRLPPLRGNPVGSAQGGTYPGDPLYNYEIGIGKESMDEPLMICALFGSYWFSNLLHVHEVTPDVQRWSDRSMMALTVADYFAYSNLNRPPDNTGYTGKNSWLTALWKMRQEAGAHFMDMAVFYAVGSPEPDPQSYNSQIVEHNKYITYRLSLGMHVIDNDSSKTRRFLEITKMIIEDK